MRKENESATIANVAAKVTRIEETYEPNFDARTFFKEWSDEAIAPHLPWMVPKLLRSRERQAETQHSLLAAGSRRQKRS